MESPQDLDIKKYYYLLYKKRYVFILTAVSIITIVVAVSYLMPKKYAASSIVFVEGNVINQLIKDIPTASLEERTKALSVVMKSRTLLLRVIGDLDIDISRMSEEEIAGLITNFQDKTEIKIGMNQSNRNNMDMFTVSYTDKNPRLARDYVNTLIRRYIDENVSAKRLEAYGATRFISEQINIYREKMDRVDAELNTLRAKNGIAQENRLLQLQKKLGSLLGQYTENHPEVIRVKAEIESLQGQLKTKRPESGQSQNEDSERSSADRERSGTVQQGYVKKSTEGRKKLSDLERERDTYKKIYEELVANLGKSEVSTQVQVQDKAGTFRILEPAILPTKPVNPNRVKIMLLGVMAGIAGGFGLIFFLDTLDTSIKKVDVLKGLGVPVLAVIPDIENAEELTKTRKKDILVYSLTGVYLLCIAIVFRELLP